MALCAGSLGHRGGAGRRGRLRAGRGGGRRHLGPQPRRLCGRGASGARGVEFGRVGPFAPYAKGGASHSFLCAAKNGARGACAWRRPRGGRRAGGRQLSRGASPGHAENAGRDALPAGGGCAGPGAAWSASGGGPPVLRGGGSSRARRPCSGCSVSPGRGLRASGSPPCPPWNRAPPSTPRPRRRRRSGAPLGQKRWRPRLPALRPRPRRTPPLRRGFLRLSGLRTCWRFSCSRTRCS